MASTCSVGYSRGRDKKSSDTRHSASDDRIGSAAVGDVFTITGLDLEYEESYFIIEKKNRYANSSAEWREVLGVEGDKRVWLEWSGHGDASVAARPDSRPVGLNAVGLSEDDLVRMDEEHSIDNTVEHDRTTYFYVNSSESFYFEDNVGEGDGFYLWEFASEDSAKMLSVVKWEGAPFQVYISDVLSPESINVYRR